jgi:hypothetical protein
MSKAKLFRRNVMYFIDLFLFIYLFFFIERLQLIKQRQSLFRHNKEW